MNYLITGGCGFIGTNLIRRLLKEDGNNKIRVIDNLSVGTREDLALVGEYVEVQGEKIGGFADRLELIPGDIEDEDLSDKVTKAADAIVHLAANTGVIPSVENPRTDCLVNVLGTFNYLQAARRNGVKRFVFASSGAPLGEQIPPIHEAMVPRPISPYGASKLSGEAYCSAFHGSFGLETVVLRFGNVYGPGSTHKSSVVSKFIKHILASEPLTIFGDGNQTRDFVFMDDLTQAIHLALDQPQIGGEVFQIATHREHTVGEVAEVLNSLALNYLGRKSPIIYENERKGEVKRNFSDITKARKMLGFEPRYDIVEGLRKTFDWFIENNRGREKE